MQGTKEFSTTWNGAELRFASAANRDPFKKYPEAYAPQCGRYCAWAVSQGYTAKGDAKFWKIVDGKLYLSYNSLVQKKWEGGVPCFIASTNRAWPEVINQIFADLVHAALDGGSPAPFQFGARVGASGWPPRGSQETRRRGV